MKNLILFFILKIFPSTLYSQDTLTIHFDPHYQQPDNVNGHGYVMLFKPKNNQLFLNKDSFKLTFPDNFVAVDTAIGFEYFTGKENPFFKNETAFLVGNYQSFNPMVYIDHNNNLNFTDDGQPVQFGLDSTALLYFRNAEIPNAYFPVKIFYYPIEKDIKEQVESFYLEKLTVSERENVTNIKYWLADLRYSYKVTHTAMNGDKIKIGLFDYNCNGLFNDKEQDRIMIGQYDNNYISDRLDAGAILYNDTNQIVLSGLAFNVIYIDPAGNFMKIIKSDKPYYKPLSPGDQLPDITVTLLNGKKSTINSLREKNKYLILDTWFAGCKGCLSDLPRLKQLAKKYKKRLQVISLNCYDGDDPERIQNYNLKNKIYWPSGIITDEVLRILRIDTAPSYLLSDQHGKILLMNSNITEIEKIIRETY